LAVDHNTRFDGIIVRLRGDSESAMFPGIVNEALAKISSKPVGKTLIDGIVSQAGKKKYGYTVCIMRPADMSIVDKNDGKGPQWSAGSVCKRGDEAASCGGTGSVSAVTWNPNGISTPDGSRPSFIGLAHELIHAYYNLLGTAMMNAKDEEYRTVGLAPHANTRDITENKIRSEHGIPARDAYSGL
jgi:hypothetical protein